MLHRRLALVHRFLVHLYSRVLRVSPTTLQASDRDYLLLSKGHDVPALYGTLAELGFFPRERLANHLKTTDTIYWHPNRNVPGIEFHSGSLGHCLSVGVGIALDLKMTGTPSRVFVVVGDGELDEGSVWEALLVASAKKLDNLVVVVDRNEFQANIRTEELVPLEPLEDKFRAFGASVRTVDGHDFAELESAFATLPREPGGPRRSWRGPSAARDARASNAAPTAGSCRSRRPRSRRSSPSFTAAPGRRSRPK